MKTALFTNFTKESFTGRWNGKARVFAPGESKWMPDYLARHFAKHLVNQELLVLGLERSTSPKKPEDVPEFMNLFNKAYTPDTEEEFSADEDSIDVQINVANKNREALKKEKQDPNEPQIVPVPEDDEDDTEDSFVGKPVDSDANPTLPEANKTNPQK